MTIGKRDEVASLSEAHNWAFRGTAGQTVTITVAAISDTDPRLQLLDPQGRYVTEDDDSGRDHGLGMWDSYLIYTQSTDDLYTVRIDIFQPGEFVVQVTSPE